MIDDEYLERHYLSKIKEQGYNDEFGATRVQMLLKIGYNAACRTLEIGAENGVLVEGSKPWKYRISNYVKEDREQGKSDDK